MSDRWLIGIAFMNLVIEFISLICSRAEMEIKLIRLHRVQHALVICQHYFY
jgi:hypothetical protein